MFSKVSHPAIDLQVDLGFPTILQCSAYPGQALFEEGSGRRPVDLHQQVALQSNIHFQQLVLLPLDAVDREGVQQLVR